MDLARHRRAVAWAILALAVLAVALSAALPPRSGSAHGASEAAIDGLAQPRDDPNPGELVAAVPLGKNPLTPVYDPFTGDFYVACYDLNNLSVISGANGSAIASIVLSAQPLPPALDTANGDLYVPTQIQNTVDVVSPKTDSVLKTIPLGANWESLPPVFDPANGDIYVASALSPTIAVISGQTNSVVANVTVPGYPLVPTFDANTGDLYVAIEGTGTVSVIGGVHNRVVTNLSEGSLYLGTGTVDPLNGDLYFPGVPVGGSALQGSILVLSGSTDSRVAELPVGGLPGTPTVDPANGDVYVSNYASGNISVLSGTSNALLGSVGVGAEPTPPTYDGGNGDLYVANDGPDTVSVLDGTTNSVVSTWRVGVDPQPAAYDAESGFLAISDKGSGNLTLAADGTVPAFGVSFLESGLSEGSLWSATISGVQENSTSNSLSLELPNGTYSLAVSSADGCSPSEVTSVLTVNGSSQSIAVAFPSGGCAATVAWTPSEAEVAAGALLGAVALLGVLFARWRADRPGRPPEEPESGAAVRAGPSSPSLASSRSRRFRLARDRRQLLWGAFAVGVAALAAGAYLAFTPFSPPAPAPSPLANYTLKLGNVTVGVVGCGGGGSVIVERIPWVASSAALSWGDVVLLIQDVSGDLLSSTGATPSVNASSVCVGTPPVPTPVAGLGNDFSWYVVLSSPSGANVATYSVTQGWTGVGPATPTAPTIANGSALTLVCNPSVSALGDYDFEGPYFLDVGVTLDETSGIPASAPL